MSNIYDKGDLVRITGTFTTAAGVATDPTAVLFSIKNPAGTTTTYTYGTDAQLVKSTTGIYYVDVNVNAVGTWYYKFYSTGTGQSASEGLFFVPPTQF
jgi:hypothetical protein